MQFRLLGPLEIIGADHEVFLPRTPKIRQLLALLLVRSNQVISVETLIRELWGDEPPKSVLTTLQTYVYHARQSFCRELCTPEDRPLLVTRSPGYVMEVPDESVDAKVFERIVWQSRTLLRDGRAEEATERLRFGLDLWRGAALADVSGGQVLACHATGLEELRIRATELLVESEEKLGRHREMVPELRSLVLRYPLHEWFHCRLINALNRSGRRAEALQARAARNK